MQDMKNLEKAKQILSQKNADAMLINSEVNMHYFCDFSPSEGIAVSYTHLDVYKRQHQYGSAMRGLPRPIKSCEPSSNCFSACSGVLIKFAAITGMLTSLFTCLLYT